MSVSQSNSYQSEAKSQWREWIYSLVTPDTCSYLVDSDGNFNYKWLELTGACDGIEQLIATDHIQESQIIGVDNDKVKTQRGKILYPDVDFHKNDWDSFCTNYQGNDIGVINFDSCNAAYGTDIEYSIHAILKLATRCQEAIGECLVIINVDSTKTYRGYAKSRNMTTEEVLKDLIESWFDKHSTNNRSTINIDTELMYDYKQRKNSTRMVSCGFIL